MSIELVNLGFDNMMVFSKAIAIVSPTSAPIKRSIRKGKADGKVIDVTNGRRTKTVIFTDNGTIILSAIAPETIARRVNGSKAE